MVGVRYIQMKAAPLLLTPAPASISGQQQQLKQECCQSRSIQHFHDLHATSYLLRGRGTGQPFNLSQDSFSYFQLETFKQKAYILYLNISYKSLANHICGPCNLCGSFLSTYRTLVDHQRMIHGIGKKSICKICNERFDNVL